jgi:hypothetical protein
MSRVPRVRIPLDEDHATLVVQDREVRLTNLRKPFWPEPGITKGACCSTTPPSPPCCCHTSAIAPW